jgi:hypothetical protein
MEMQHATAPNLFDRRTVTHQHPLNFAVRLCPQRPDRGAVQISALYVLEALMPLLAQLGHREPRVIQSKLVRPTAVDIPDRQDVGKRLPSAVLIEPFSCCNMAASRWEAARMF